MLSISSEVGTSFITPVPEDSAGPCRLLSFFIRNGQWRLSGASSSAPLPAHATECAPGSSSASSTRATRPGRQPCSRRRWRSCSRGGRGPGASVAVHVEYSRVFDASLTCVAELAFAGVGCPARSALSKRPGLSGLVARTASRVSRCQKSWRAPLIQAGAWRPTCACRAGCPGTDRRSSLPRTATCTWRRCPAHTSIPYLFRLRVSVTSPGSRGAPEMTHDNTGTCWKWQDVCIVWPRD